MTKQSFVHGAMILLASSLITHLLGMAYRSVLARVIGPEGMGLFQMVSPILFLAMSLVRAGLPSAISKLVAESLAVGNYRRIRRIMIVTSSTIIGSAILFTILLYVMSPWITHHILSDPRAYYALISTIPLVLVIALSSILYGYFQGTQNMGPIGTANILEMIVRIISVWVLATYFIHFGLALAAAAAGIGMVAGESVSFIYLLIRFYAGDRTRINTRQLSAHQSVIVEPFGRTLYSISEIAVPVTISSIVGSIGYWAESYLIPRCLLWAGYSQAAATTMFGQFASMAVPLLFFPSVFTGSLTTTLVPAIAEAVAAKKVVLVARRLYQAFRVTALIGLPASVVMTLFAGPLCMALYNDASVGPMLTFMAPFGFLMYFGDPLVGVLQGLNRAGTLMLNSIIGNVISLALIFLLAKRPGLNIYGVGIALVVSISVVTVLNFIAVYRLVGFYFHVVETVKLVCCTMGLFVLLVQLRAIDFGFGVLGNTVISITTGLSIYGAALLMTRVVTSADLERIPRIGPFLTRITRLVPYAK